MARKQIPGGTSRDLFGNAHGVGKGDKPRNIFSEDYRRNYERAFGKKERIPGGRYAKKY